MSDEETKKNDQNEEPSMEDILASIRRILAEDEEDEMAAKAQTETPGKAEGDKVASPEPETKAPAEEPQGQDDIDALFDSPSQEPEPVAAPIPEPEVQQPKGQDDIDALFETSAPEPAPEPEPVAAPKPEPTPQPEEASNPTPSSGSETDVLELTPAMVTGDDTVLSATTYRHSSDILGELARAVLDQRDVAVGGRDATLEGMVREMLKPILREWLDRNLPYLIERLVKKEIDLMINRAERLDGRHR